MSKLEYCSKCGDYDVPFCEHLYAPATPSPANGADPDNMAESYDHSTHDKRMEVLKGLRDGAVGEMPVAFIAPRLLESLSNYREAAPTPSNFSVAVQAGQRNGEDLPLYSADQLRAAVLAERAAIAKMVEDQSLDSPDYIAECIRART